jgi:hypothetical protein
MDGRDRWRNTRFHPVRPVNFTTRRSKEARTKERAMIRSTFRRRLTSSLLAATSAVLLAVPAHAREDGPPPAPGPGVPARPQPPDKELRAILRSVDRANLEATVNKLVSFGTRHTESNQDLNAARGIGPAVKWIFDTLSGYAAQSNGRMKVELQEFVVTAGSPRITQDTIVRNVVATITGTDSPGRTYVMSGHIDSRVTDVLVFDAVEPGAADEASGVAVMMELARIFSTRAPKATIVLTGVSGEEQNLYGSAFQAARFKAAGADIQGMFSDDIVGSSTAEDGTRDAHTLRMFTEGVPTAETPTQAAIRRAIGGEVDGPSRELGRFVKSVAENDETDMFIRHVYRRDRYLRASDHVSYLSNGYTAARFTEPAENYDHEHQDVRVENGVQFGDLVQFMDFDYLARVAKVNAAVMWSLANAPGAPRSVFIDASSLTNTSTLTWTRGTEPDLAGYEVLWRETTDPDWTHVIAVGDVTTAAFPHFSRDNVFWGVRAVDRAGHRSPVAFPLPR